MVNNFITILIFSLSVAVAYAAPTHNNPWFAWRSMEYAKRELHINNPSLSNEQCVFSNKVNSIVFKNGRRLAELDGVSVWLNVAPETVNNGKNWRVSAIDLDLLSLTMQAEAAEKPRKLKVMIDAGHGGSDSGAISNCKTLKEKDVTLDLALKTGKLLKKAGVKVLYTRTKDKTLSLTDRSTAASRQKADLFVSIHANKASNTNACGVETFVLTPSGYSGTAANSPPRGWQIGNKNDYNSNLLGYSIQNALIEEKNVFDRGLKRQSFFVLRETYCPATLVEVGFLSNTDDLTKMKSKKWRNACARKISDGILNYCRKVDSLEKAVAAKRKREAEASKRWRAYLAAKQNKQTEADLHKKVVKVAKRPSRTSQYPISKVSKIEQTTKSKQHLKTVEAHQEIRPPENGIAKNTTQDVVKAKPADTKPLTELDLAKLTAQEVQSVATNIYLSKEDSAQTAQKKNEGDLKSLMDFYEKGSLN